MRERVLALSIRAVRALNAPGVFHPRGIRGAIPASILFSCFEELSQLVTHDLYTDVLELELGKDSLRPVAELLADLNQDESRS